MPDPGDAPSASAGERDGADLAQPLLVHQGDGQRLLPLVESEAVLPRVLPGAGLVLSTVVLSKTILGAGMAALPRAFSLLGLGVALPFLLAMGFMTDYSISALALGTLATGHFSYPEVVRALCGRGAALLLELCLVVRCFGLMLVYEIVAADILAGSAELSGLLCDWAGAGAGGWCSNRPLVTGVLTVTVLAPLASYRRLASTALTSWIGMLSCTVLAAATLGLAAAAAAKGAAHHMAWAPDWAALGRSPAEVATQLLAVIPILATAFTCQMAAHFVMRDLKSFSQARVQAVSAFAVGVTTSVFLALAIGSWAVFGDAVSADVLANFNHKALSPLVGEAAARVLYTVVRVGFLLSIITILPMQMAPYRESLCRVAFGRELHGAPYYAVTYASVAAIYVAALLSGSIWGPLMLIGATAGACIAFFFPGWVALRAADAAQPAAGRSAGYWRWWRLNAWALIAVGAVQAVTGTAAAVMNFNKGRGGGPHSVLLGLAV